MRGSIVLSLAAFVTLTAASSPTSGYADTVAKTLKSDANVITIDVLGAMVGLYSTTLKRPFTSGLSGRLTASYENPKLGHLTNSRFPGNVESMVEASGALGLEWHPFVSSFSLNQSNQWLKGAFIVSEVALGHHSTVMEDWGQFGDDSTVAKGNWLAPAVRLGYETVILNHLILTPEVGYSYRTGRLSFAGLRPEVFEPNGTAKRISRNKLVEDHTGWQPLFGLSLGKKF